METRIAIVMNGGISLAGWMGGVTHERNRLRLASLDIEPPDEAQKEVRRAWRAILDHAGANVVALDHGRELAAVDGVVVG